MPFGYRSLVLAVFAVSVPALAAAAHPCGVPHTTAAASLIERIRPLDDVARQTVEHGRAGSAQLRELLDAIAGSDLIVHIITADTVTPLSGVMRFVASRGAYRYIRIVLDRRLSLDVRAATLAHELRHACEVAASDVRDQEGIRRLYERIGYKVHGLSGHFDTTAATQAGARAWRELHGERTTQHK